MITVIVLFVVLVVALIADWNKTAAAAFFGIVFLGGGNAFVAFVTLTAEVAR